MESQENINEIKTYGEKGNINFHMRLTNSQYGWLGVLSESLGHKNLFSFVRAKCLDHLSQERKLNQILELNQK